MDSEDLYGLTLNQHKTVERLDRKDRVTHRGNTEQATRDKARYRGIARVILFEGDDPVYTPRTQREVAIFEFQPDGQQITIELSGHALEGDLVLTIDGNEIHVACDVTTEELRAALEAHGITLADCRATVFPALWEFDFNFGRWAEQAPSLTCEPFEPPAEDTETPVYSGNLTITAEGWCSVTEDGDTYQTVETTDWIPHRTGVVTTGAIGAALWCFAAGWMVLTWQCRDYSFAIPDPYSGGG